MAICLITGRLQQGSRAFKNKFTKRKLHAVYKLQKTLATRNEETKIPMDKKRVPGRSTNKMEKVQESAKGMIIYSNDEGEEKEMEGE